MKRFQKFLALLTLISLTIYALPVNAVTTDNKMEEIVGATDFQTSDVSDMGYNADTGELVALREESVKHFRMEDGTYQAIAYGNPVHRKNAEGIWQDIDNRLTASLRKSSRRFTTSDGTRSFAPTASERELFTLNDGEHTLSMAAAFASGQTTASTASVQNHGTPSAYSIHTDKSDPEVPASADTTTRVTYENVLDGIDLEYLLVGNDVKENIILNSRSDGDYRYVFELYLTGLEAELLDDGSIGLYDSSSDELSYRMPAPYMYDKNGEISYDVNYKTECVDSRLFICVEASSEWINDADRAFPVVIDPTLIKNASQDTYISSQFPNTNYGSSERIWISANATAFIYSIMPALPSNATVTSASLNVAYYYYDSVTSGYVRVGTYLVGQSWTESKLTWTSANETTNLGISTTMLASTYMYGNVSATEASPKWTAFSIPSIVMDMYAGIPNYGIALKYLSGTNSSVILKSKETGSTYCPYLSMTYTLDTLTVPNGSYYFRNGDLGNYMRTKNGSTANNAIIESDAINGSKDQLWTCTYLHNGYYRIISENSHKAISVQIGKEDDADTALVQTTSSANYQQQWKITKTSHGMYKIKARSSESYSTDLCMAAGSGILTSSGRNVEQRKYVDDSNYKDEWILQSPGNTTFLLGIEETGLGHDHVSCFTDVMGHLSGTQYNNYNIIYTNYISVTNARSNAANAKIVVTRSHGGFDANGTYICLSNTDTQSNLGSSEIYNFSTSTPVVDLSNCELILFVACYTGNHSTQSLPHAAVKAGAKCSVGFEKELWCTTANDWINYFFEYYIQGFDVETACLKASNKCGNVFNINTYRIVSQ